jgi:hypothetical protein
MTDRLERLINLVIALRETRRPMTAADIRTRVAGYGQSDQEAFRRMFERDKADLRDLGVPVETASLEPYDDRPGYRIDPRQYNLPDVRLAADELAALALAVEATGLTDDGGTRAVAALACPWTRRIGRRWWRRSSATPRSGSGTGRWVATWGSAPWIPTLWSTGGGAGISWVETTTATTAGRTGWTASKAA